MKNVSIVELNEKLKDNVNVIDIREPYELAWGKVPGAKNVPIRELAYNHQEYLTPGEEYYIICQSGSRSVQLISFLSKENYELYNVVGGTGMYGVQFELER